MNNGKYRSASYQRKQALKNDRLFGPVQDYIKQCEECEQDYVWRGRKGINPKEPTKQYLSSRFCCVSHARKWAGQQPTTSTNYRTIAKQYHDSKCCICGFNEIVEVHHFDYNSKNNEPSNLAYLCPNHHRMIHNTKYNDLLRPYVLEYIESWKKEIGHE